MVGLRCCDPRDNGWVATRRKTADVLDEMIEHVRYEIAQAWLFAKFANGWAEQQLRPVELAVLTRNSLLEGGLIHLRCLIEFLGDKPTHDRVRARDYLPDDWDWVTNGQLTRVSDLSSRLAHLGTDRVDAFDWSEWFNAEAPIVFEGVRHFLVQLRATSPARYKLFLQPGPHLPAKVWTEIWDSLLDNV